MPFDPNLPAANSPIVSAELRDQFNGLDDKYDLAISGCALNPSYVELLDLPISNPPTARPHCAISLYPTRDRTTASCHGASARRCLAAA